MEFKFYFLILVNQKLVNQKKLLIQDLVNYDDNYVFGLYK